VISWYKRRCRAGGTKGTWFKRLRAITIGLLTPFYFLRAGYFVSIPAVILAPFGVIALLIAEIAAKVVSVYPVARVFKAPQTRCIQPC
jgi:glutathione-regulated potassium-efflux system ancillary protein KefC